MEFCNQISICLLPQPAYSTDPERANITVAGRLPGACVLQDTFQDDVRRDNGEMEIETKKSVRFT